MTGFAVVDLETTGFGRYDRVVEIGVVLLTADGEVEATIETLVNPNRDIGATHIHGITARDVFDAPFFDDLAPYLKEIFEERAIVAHNASFDLRFLEQEFSFAGVAFSAENLPVLCTMELATQFLPGSGRTLAACCECFDITITDAHSALSDASATAELFRAFLGVAPGLREFSPELPSTTHASSAASNFQVALKTRRSVSEPLDAVRNFLLSTVQTMSDHELATEERALFSLYDVALSDGLISAEEAHDIAKFHADSTIDDEHLVVLNKLYFADFVTAALADGELNTAERVGIRFVAEVLGQRPQDVDEIFRLSEVQPQPLLEEQPLESIPLEVGDKVVLTGDMTRPRSIYEAELTRLGYSVWPSVTKQVKLVIAADVHSMSGKAKRARLLGIPVVAESRFFSELSS